MKFIQFCASYALLSPTLASISRRDFSTVYNDLLRIDTEAKTFTNDYVGLSNPPTGSQIIKLTGDFNSFCKGIQQANSDCNSNGNPAFSAANAQQIITYCNNPYEPDIGNLVTCAAALKRRSPPINIGSQSSLSWCQGNMTLLNNCLLSKMPATPTSIKASATSCFSKVNCDMASLAAGRSPTGCAGGVQN